jgi:hypothetical protein
MNQPGYPFWQVPFVSGFRVGGAGCRRRLQMHFSRIGRQIRPLKDLQIRTTEYFVDFCDPASGQIVMIAAGILTFGTLGAAELLFKPDLFNEFVQQAPAGWESKNFQALIQVSVINTDSSIPKIVATHFW